MISSNVGKWDRWYNDAPARPYGSTLTYRLGYAFLQGCSLIEDWGCGFGYFETLCRPRQCLGLDGSQTAAAGKIVDLVEYTSQVDGIFIRHVLEHDLRWEAILKNALTSFRQRMVLILFTPFAERMIVLRQSEYPAVPVIAFSKAGIEAIIAGAGCGHASAELPTDTEYEIECIFFIWKSGALL